MAYNDISDYRINPITDRETPVRVEELISLTDSVVTTTQYFKLARFILREKPVAGSISISYPDSPTTSTLFRDTTSWKNAGTSLAGIRTHSYTIITESDGDDTFVGYGELKLPLSQELPVKIKVTYDGLGSQVNRKNILGTVFETDALGAPLGINIPSIMEVKPSRVLVGNENTCTTSGVVIGEKLRGVGTNIIAIGSTVGPDEWEKGRIIGDGGIGVGTDVKVLGNYGIGVGVKSLVNYDGGIAIGANVRAGGKDSIAIGTYANSQGDSSIAIRGTAGVLTPLDLNTAQKAEFAKRQSWSLAIGDQSESAFGGISIGYRAGRGSSFGVKKGSIIIGNYNYPAEDSVIIGSTFENKAGDSFYSQALGFPESVSSSVGERGVTIGYGAKGAGSQSITLGCAVVNEASSSVCIGVLSSSGESGSTTAVDGTITIGALSKTLKSKGIAIGNTAESLAVGAISIGGVYITPDQTLIKTSANKDYNISIGSGAVSDGEYSVSIGFASATVERGVALGPSTSVSSNGVGVGYGVSAGERSTVVGASATAINNSVAVGESAEASGVLSTAVGQNATASEVDCTAFGQSAKATGRNSTALGQDSISSGNYTVSIGNGSRSAGNNCISLGYDARAEGGKSLAIGKGTRASSFDTVAIGEGTQATGRNSTCIGSSAKDNDNANCVSIGYEADSMGANAVTIGFDSKAHDDAVALGHLSFAESNNIAIGSGTEAGRADATRVPGTYPDTICIGRNVKSPGKSNYLISSDLSLEQDSYSSNIAVGIKPTLVGSNNVIVGHNCTARANSGTVSVGHKNSAWDRTIIIGQSCSSYFFNTIIGFNSTSLDVGSDGLARNNTIIGSSVIARSSRNVLIGDSLSTTVGNDGNIAIGYGIDRVGTGIVGIGDKIKTGDKAVIIGHTASGEGANSVTIGHTASGNGVSCIAVGYKARALTDSISIGKESGLLSASNTINIGSNANAMGQGGIAIGQNCVAEGRGVNIGSPITAEGTEIRIGDSNYHETALIGKHKLENGRITKQSDIRDKANVRECPFGLDFINSLRVVEYHDHRRSDYTGRRVVRDENGNPIRHPGFVHAVQELENKGIVVDDFFIQNMHGFDPYERGLSSYAERVLSNVQSTKRTLEVAKVKPESPKRIKELQLEYDKSMFVTEEYFDEEAHKAIAKGLAYKKGFGIVAQDVVPWLMKEYKEHPLTALYLTNNNCDEAPGATNIDHDPENMDFIHGGASRLCVVDTEFIFPLMKAVQEISKKIDTIPSGEGVIVTSTKTCIGNRAESTGACSVVVGNHASDRGNHLSTVIGCRAMSRGENGIAIGSGATAYENTITIGSREHKFTALGDSVLRGGRIIYASDARDKVNIKPNELGLDFINKIETFTYNENHRDDYTTINPETGEKTFNEKAYKNQEKVNKHTDIGVSAQQVKKLLGDDSDKYNIVHNIDDRLLIDYQAFIPMLIKAVQEQSREIKELKEEIKALKATV